MEAPHLTGSEPIRQWYEKSDFMRQSSDETIDENAKGDILMRLLRNIEIITSLIRTLGVGRCLG